MTILGRGAVAIWHDIAPEGREEFYAWHSREHMPQRVGVPGFLRGRRFIAIDADLEFLIIYETRSADVVRGPEYRASLNAPTPWTLATVKHFRSVARALTQVAASLGTADGGIIATLRSNVADDRMALEPVVMAERVLPGLCELPGVAGAHLLVADMEASGEVNAEQRARGAANAVPRWALLIEGWGDEASFIATVRQAVTPDRLWHLGATGTLSLGFYRHQITLTAA
jgi:hypothetical protein